jgi:hypothetical protein
MRRITVDDLKNKRYIEDVVSGMAQSDRHFNTVYALLGKYGLAELVNLNIADSSKLADCAAAIRRVRMCD